MFTIKNLNICSPLWYPRAEHVWSDWQVLETRTQLKRINCAYAWEDRFRLSYSFDCRIHNLHDLSLLLCVSCTLEWDLIMWKEKKLWHGAKKNSNDSKNSKKNLNPRFSYCMSFHAGKPILRNVTIECFFFPKS